ncbi:tigger transposable element-derived protein 1-like [Macrobrachium rosenbergii]|uniref:tigger transposable element-derived protein 1-like n=1 Tax=Macrobrachium rosenbergii TaxID=79674 RepID=UPI0034D463A1
MAPKQQNSSSDASASKKPRKSITMEVKYDVIKRSEKGESNTEIGCALGLNRTMVVTIVKDKQRILKHVQEAAPMKATVINVKQRSQNVVEMEKLLLIWLEDQNQRRVPNDSVAAESFPSGLAEIIRKGGYTAKQVFNVDETGLFWKRMPNRTYISKEERSAPAHKARKKKLTLLFGANASSDLKLKPLLVYLAENPRAFKGVFKRHLPVIWKSNKKAWVTLMVFED